MRSARSFCITGHLVQRRACAAAATAAENLSNSASTSSSSNHTSADEGSSTNKVAKARSDLIDAIMQRDKEIFTLKRQHELSMLRVEHHQNRILKDQTDRGIYYEQNCNVHTFDTISVGMYSQRNTMYYANAAQRLREVKIGLTLFVTFIVWCYMYRYYMWSDEMMYVSEPAVLWGSQAVLVKQEKMKVQEELEHKEFVQKYMGSGGGTTPAAQ